MKKDDDGADIFTSIGSGIGMIIAIPIMAIWWVFSMIYRTLNPEPDPNQELLKEAEALLKAHPILRPDQVLEPIFDKSNVTSDVAVRFAQFCAHMYAYYIPMSIPPMPEGEVPKAQWRDEVKRRMALWRDMPYDDIIDAMFDALEVFVTHTPTTAMQTEKTGITYKVPYSNEAIHEVVSAFLSSSTRRELYYPFSQHIHAKMHELAPNNKPITPLEYKGDARLFILGTPIEDFLDFEASFSLPDDRRFEHMHIVGGSGHGKTQTLQYFISQDLQKDCSVVVMDSQGQLIERIQKLEGLQDRLVIIDPTDLAHPPALNIFDLSISGNELEREALTNSAIELMEYVLGAVLGSEMTARQGTLFRFCLRLLLTTEGATIHTLKEIMEGNLPPLDKLPPTSQQFFRQDFQGRQFNDTKQQVIRRLWTILENTTLTNLLSAPKSKLDIAKELDEGKVILINTSKYLLKQTGTEIMGRCFLALIALAIQERANRPNAKPVYFYVDELQDYARGGEGYLEVMLEQFRKYRCGMIMAHQSLSQIGTLAPTLAANTAIKFAGGVSASDANAFAREMRCDAQFILNQPKLSFAASVRGDGALSVKIPVGYMEALPTMSQADHLAMRARNVEQYCYRPGGDAPQAPHESSSLMERLKKAQQGKSEQSPRQSQTPHTEPPAPDDDIKPSKDW